MRIIGRIFFGGFVVFSVLVVLISLAHVLRFFEMPTFNVLLGDAAPAESIESIEITDFGSYDKVETAGRKVAGKTSAGYTLRVKRKLRERTERIPAVMDDLFGVEYVVRGKPDNGVLEITIKLSHPGMKEPNRKDTFYKDEWKNRAFIGQKNFAGWIFERNWERSAGKWTYELWYDGKKYAEKSFEVYLPEN